MEEKIKENEVKEEIEETGGKKQKKLNLEDLKRVRAGLLDVRIRNCLAIKGASAVNI